MINTFDGLQAPLYLVALRNSRSLHFHHSPRSLRDPIHVTPFSGSLFPLCLFFSFGVYSILAFFFFSFPLKQSFTPAPSRVIVRLVHRNRQALSPMTRPMRG
ncbi:uncharacterized protein BO66DRAFT_163808 [Aspergillus aculeatinus CBS 121060]|uniref:Uncharacterized protein n=1 Tax=Aspergillus aculeatinus CBS 121060 TaxID=1448322 RepID=A0ACD1GZZ3_9EURO|nr:hypothetical protein BO66DRAFT_163808 [Aspergillus aculeatinus CBS 121060]RAH66907.1 hypothetical protein BO66DRAFT_163808 [Aspergillus aculeatinus CBS 121060]